MIQLNDVVIGIGCLFRGGFCLTLQHDRGEETQVANLEDLLDVTVTSLQVFLKLLCVRIVKFNRDVWSRKIVVDLWQLLAFGQALVFLLKAKLLLTQWASTRESQTVEHLLPFLSRKVLWEVTVRDFCAFRDIHDGANEHHAPDEGEPDIVDAARVHHAHDAIVARI